MDFFAQQENARKQTVRLVFLFLGAVLGVIGAADLVITFGAWWLFDLDHLPRRFHQVLAVTILAAIVFFALKRLYKLRGGGEAIAKMVSARQVLRNAGGLEEQRLLNVVDEMAIAAGVTVPSVWVMDTEEGINAFAAGYSLNQAVIVVTKGALTKLNREELQGVVGHEFGHILNGDMRLNVRLIGILAGIVIVGEAGLVVIKLGAEAGDSGALPFIIMGALIAATGYIGLFCGRIIKAAVSRQREFLADASSVQFTRNPAGLASALEKIRKGEGTGVKNAYAGEMSHMFFGQAFQPKWFEDLFATHPPIEERLAVISGRKYEAPQAPATAVDFAGTVLAKVGQAMPEHIERAMNLLAALPPGLRASLNTPENARCAVYAYLVSSDPEVRAVQDRTLEAAGDSAKKAGLETLAATLRMLGPTARLPVLTLALPALRQMPQAERDRFLAAVGALVEADSVVTLDEFVIRTILRRQLAAKSTHAEPVRFRDINAVKAEALLLLATLARAGASEPQAQANAFARGVARLGLTATLPPDAPLHADAVSDALDRLRQLAPLKKASVVLACVDTALADQVLLVPEMELLRTIGMAIDCPLPPMVETHAVESRGSGTRTTRSGVALQE